MEMPTDIEVIGPNFPENFLTQKKQKLFLFLGVWFAYKTSCLAIVRFITVNFCNEKNKVIQFTKSGWWFQPIWNILVKMGIFHR